MSEEWGDKKGKEAAPAFSNFLFSSNLNCPLMKSTCLGMSPGLGESLELSVGQIYPGVLAVGPAKRLSSPTTWVAGIVYNRAQ